MFADNSLTKGTFGKCRDRCRVSILQIIQPAATARQSAQLCGRFSAMGAIRMTVDHALSQALAAGWELHVRPARGAFEAIATKRQPGGSGSRAKVTRLFSESVSPLQALQNVSKIALEKGGN